MAGRRRGGGRAWRGGEGRPETRREPREVGVGRVLGGVADGGVARGTGSKGAPLVGWARGEGGAG